MHLLFALSRTLTIAQAAEIVKTNSSKWLKRQRYELAGFRWQGGYGSFSVSEGLAKRVTDYILNQEEHHRTVSFQDEYRTLMRRANIEYDERYVWD